MNETEKYKVKKILNKQQKKMSCDTRLNEKVIYLNMINEFKKKT